MNSAWDRRRFLQVTGCAALGLGVAGWARSGEPAKQLANGAPHAEKLGWRLGCQAYSFNRFTFFEALAKNQSLGLRYIEAYPGQSLSVEKKDVKVGAEMSAEARSDVKKQLADTGIQLVNYGVCGLSKDESASRRTFDFAADMGIETIVSEPPFDAFDTIEKLCDEYRINVAIHNHPSPSPYWNPDKVLEMCKGRTKRIGACADTGHWMRSELNPVEQVKKLEGRLISFHFKDLNKFGRDAHDVPWGTGQADAKAILAEVYRQKVRAVFSIEYEHNWTTSLPEIAQCVEFFDRAGKTFGG